MADTPASPAPPAMSIHDKLETVARWLLETAARAAIAKSQTVNVPTQAVQDAANVVLEAVMASEAAT